MPRHASQTPKPQVKLAVPDEFDALQDAKAAVFSDGEALSGYSEALGPWFGTPSISKSDEHIAAG
jgi:hypothetical protein